MYNAGDDRRLIRLVSHHEDTPTRISGFLIPAGYAARGTGRARARSRKTVPPITLTLRRRTIALLCTAVLLLSLTFGAAAHWITEGVTTMAAPIVVVASDEMPEPVPLHYGTQPLLSQPNFFADTRDSFIADQLTFIEADLAKMKITYYEEGAAVFSAPILAKGKEGSWWETPAGLYEVEQKKEDHRSSFGSVQLPWSMVFQGNFFIHGWPKRLDGTPVPEGNSGGCIRLSDEDAAALYERVTVDTPVLVHEADFASDDFVYEPKAPDISADQYLVADVHNNTILASSDLDAVVPIASITKLMTALVAAEHINLDEDVYVSQEKYVTTLVPRLEGRYYVSMYSLLQLLLVESSNEAAEVIATQVGREKFIQLMNEKALALGLSDTTFADPSGLEDGNVSTVGDLLRLVQYIHHNRSFILELTHDQDLPTAYTSGEFGELENFNTTEDIHSFIGGKVGETQAAGQTSVSLHELWINGSRRTIAFVLLGSEDRELDLKKLLSYTKEQFAQPPEED